MKNPQEPPLTTEDAAERPRKASSAVAKESCLQVAFCERTAQEMQAILKSYSHDDDNGPDDSKGEFNALEWGDSSDDDDDNMQQSQTSEDVDRLCRATRNMALTTTTGSAPPFGTADYSKDSGLAVPFARGGTTADSVSWWESFGDEVGLPSDLLCRAARNMTTTGSASGADYSKDSGLAVTQPWWWESFGEEACRATRNMALTTTAPPGTTADSVTQPSWWQSFGQEAGLPSFSSSSSSFSSSLPDLLHMQARLQTSDVDRICSALDTLIRTASSSVEMENAFAAAEALAAAMAPSAAAEALAAAVAPAAKATAAEKVRTDTLATLSTHRRRHRRHHRTTSRARDKESTKEGGRRAKERESTKESGRQRKKKTKKVSKAPKIDEASTQERRLRLWMHY